MKKYLPLLCLLLTIGAHAQTNILSTNPVAEQVMLGNYSTSTYQASTIINDPAIIAQELNARISPDSMHYYLDVLRSYHNRNTVSDTVSNNIGIGAARRWVYSMFQQFSVNNQNRLLPSYLQFDQAVTVCPNTKTQHRNIFAVLPGTDISDNSIIIIEGHIDSRCADNCDTNCTAEGMEDNGSGTALVIELARVMSKYSYNHTIVFMATIGEEQGLLGAEAFAQYAVNKGIKIKAVLNNDVIGGIICGQTSSPPGCPGLNNIDSTHVRLFSDGGFNSAHKQLSRYIKLEYKEMIQPIASVVMGINIMTPEDRTGRGGDHIPFRQHGFTAMRFTSANEHGDANVTAPGYSDRQHTSSDVLGTDNNSDGFLDSFFVDFNYLARNAVINGNAASMIGISPMVPDFKYLWADPNEIRVEITQQTQYPAYRLAVRNASPVNNDWDSVYTFTGTTFTAQGLTPGSYIISVAAVDSKGVESLFSKELMINTKVSEPSYVQPDIELLQNRPNPADEATMISVLVNKPISYKEAYISVTDILGREVKRTNISLKQGMNEITFSHGYNMTGTFIYSLVVDGKPLQSKKMVFTN
jgi:hypothetical protein